MSALRVVLDTNIFVSALLGKGPPARLYEAFREGTFEIVLSNPLLAEITRVLLRPDLAIPAKDIKTAFKLLRRRARIVRPAHPVNVCRDPKDNFVLECALSSNAGWIVTGDRDLLILNPFREIRIVSPSVFLKHLSI